jgi:hypothetical protein
MSCPQRSWQPQPMPFSAAKVDTIARHHSFVYQIVLNYDFTEIGK